jgi:hypothetical protein
MEINQLRKIQILFVIGVLVFGAVAEVVSQHGIGDWTWRHWVVAGVALWSVTGGYRFRRISRMRSEQALSGGDSYAKVVRKWGAVQLANLAAAESVALWGVVIRLGLHGARWQALPFYLLALFLLFLWRPQPLIRIDGTPTQS